MMNLTKNVIRNPNEDSRNKFIEVNDEEYKSHILKLIVDELTWLFHKEKETNVDSYSICIIGIHLLDKIIDVGFLGKPTVPSTCKCKTCNYFLEVDITFNCDCYENYKTVEDFFGSFTVRELMWICEILYNRSDELQPFYNSISCLYETFGRDLALMKLKIQWDDDVDGFRVFPRFDDEDDIRDKSEKELQKLSEKNVEETILIKNTLDAKCKQLWRQTNMNREQYHIRIRRYLIGGILLNVSKLFNTNDKRQLRSPTIMIIMATIMRKLNTNGFLESDFMSMKCKDCGNIVPYDIKLYNNDYTKWRTSKDFIESYSTRDLEILFAHLLEYQQKIKSIFYYIRHRYMAIGDDIFEENLQVEWDYWVGEFVVREKPCLIEKKFPIID